MKKVLSIVLMAIMLFTMSVSAFADGTEGTKKAVPKGTVTVAINAEFTPFEYYEAGKLTGFDIEFMELIGERIGYDMSFVDMSFDKLISAVINGEADCAVSAITVTKERDNVIDYTVPYLRANMVYKDGGDTTESVENYAIVFPDGVSNTIFKSSMPTEKEKIYLLVNDAIKALKDDGEIERLIDKYDLNKPFDNEAEYNFEYMTVNDTAAEGSEIKAMNEGMVLTEDAGSTVTAPSEWAAKDIDFAYALGITDNNREYVYKENITREEFCEMIYNLIMLVNQDIESFISDSFTDTKNEKVLTLNSMGIINGKTATEFAPKDSLTREEAASIIIRMVREVMPELAAAEEWFNYNDMDDISDWASESVQVISNMGFMNGVENNNFAPKDTYTIEQAISTLVRVYNSAEKAGLIKNNSSIGIIGGADGPTAVFTGGNVKVIEDEDYGKFYDEVKKNTIKVDDFYVDKAVKLAEESGKLASDEKLIEYYTHDGKVKDKILEFGRGDYSKPSAIYYLAADKKQIIANMETLDEEYFNKEDINIMERLFELNKVNFNYIAALINSSYGTESLAAFTILANSEGYIMPKNFEKNFALYLEYENGCSAIVSFSKYGEDVISANMSFVVNGNKDNIFRRVYEIIQGLGENSIEVAKVIK